MKLPKNLLVNDSKTINGISCLSLDFNNLQKKRVKCKVNRSKFQKLIHNISILVVDDYEA